MNVLFIATISSSLSNEHQVPIVDHLVHYRNMFATPDLFIRRKVDYAKMRVFNEKYRKESERIETYKNFPVDKKHLVDSLVKSGFFCTENDFVQDQVKCIFCQGTLDDWKVNMLPMKRHKRSYPTCPFVISLNVANEPKPIYSTNPPKEDPNVKFFNEDSPEGIECCISKMRSALPEIFGTINHLEVDWREETFKDDPALTCLALGGLFIETNKNRRFLTCCWCKKSTEILDGVEDLDESVFHKKDCQIHLMEEDNNVSMEDIPKEFCEVEYAVTTQEIEARTETNPIYQSLSKGTSKDDIKSVIERRLKETGKDFESLYEFLKAVKRGARPTKTSSPKGDNIANVTLAEFQCVVCLDKVVEVIFLPCGHLKTCETCSSAMITCPVCREMIERRVKHMRFNDSSLMSI